MKRMLSLSSVARLIAAGLLFYSLKRHPYSYYTMLRWVTCGVGAYSTYLALKNEQAGWAWTLGILTVMFNPIIPVYLDRKMWAYIDVAAAVLLILSILFVQERPIAETASVNSR